MIVLQGARERVDVLQFSPDGGMLVAPFSGGVQVWNDIAAGDCPATIFPHPCVRSLRFTPDGRMLLLHGIRLVVHNLATGQAAEVPLEMPVSGTFCDLSPDGRLLVAAEVQYPGEPPGRLSCRPLDDLASPVWAFDMARRACGGPLFLADGERFVLFEWLAERIPGGYRYSMAYVTRNARDGNALSEATAAGHEFGVPVMSADKCLVAARRGVWVAVFRAEDFGAEPVVLRNVAVISMRAGASRHSIG